jgi:hypothetical protein
VLLVYEAYVVATYFLIRQLLKVITMPLFMRGSPLRGVYPSGDFIDEIHVTQIKA